MRAGKCRSPTNDKGIEPDPRTEGRGDRRYGRPQSSHPAEQGRAQLRIRRPPRRGPDPENHRPVEKISLKEARAKAREWLSWRERVGPQGRGESAPGREGGPQDLRRADGGLHRSPCPQAAQGNDVEREIRR